MNKRIVSLLLALAVSFAAASCTRSKKEESKSTTAETEVSKTTETEAPATESSATVETTEAETTTSTETEKTEATALNPDIEPADEFKIQDLKPKDYSNATNVTYLEAVPENTEGLTEGPKYYQYAMCTIYVKYDAVLGTIPPGILIVSNVRCVVSNKELPDGTHKWMIDDDKALDDAIKKYCADNNITIKDLGNYMHTYTIQSIDKKFYSSLRYVSKVTHSNHERDGDIYAL